MLGPTPLACTATVQPTGGKLPLSGGARHGVQVRALQAAIAGAFPAGVQGKGCG